MQSIVLVCWKKKKITLCKPKRRNYKNFLLENEINVNFYNNKHNSVL